jgi:hypothetical protein
MEKLPRDILQHIIESREDLGTTREIANRLDVQFFCGSVRLVHRILGEMF